MLPGAEGEAQPKPAIRRASLAALSPGRYAAVLTVSGAAGGPDSADPIAVLVRTMGEDATCAGAGDLSTNPGAGPVSAVVKVPLEAQPRVHGLGISHLSTVYLVTHALTKLLSAGPGVRLIDRMWQ